MSGSAPHRFDTDTSLGEVRRRQAAMRLRLRRADQMRQREEGDANRDPGGAAQQEHQCQASACRQHGAEPPELPVRQRRRLGARNLRRQSQRALARRWACLPALRPVE